MSSAKNNSNSITSVEGGNTENVKGLGTVISNKTQSFASIVKDNAMSNFKFPERDQAIVFDTIDDTQKNDYIIDKFLDNHKGITLQDKFINARRLVSTAKRVILSNVSPCIPHNIVEEHLKRAGLDPIINYKF
ncbi:hypothetical protein QE152_g37462 [Popillia japonica]|uniref:Uncharacterized protein n=1 Tax=Popillia japonica TaxID=7064 RepID=A0AAW1IAH0_POPJA